MNTSTTVVRDPAGLLRGTLRANAAFTALAGAICVLDAGPLADFAGLMPALGFEVLGVLLLGYAAAVYWASTRPHLTRGLGLIAAALDLAWVLGSVALLLAGWLPMTVAGKWLVAGVADIVAILAVLEFVGARRIR